MCVVWEKLFAQAQVVLSLPWWECCGRGRSRMWGGPWRYWKPASEEGSSSCHSSVRVKSWQSSELYLPPAVGFPFLLLCSWSTRLCIQEFRRSLRHSCGNDWAAFEGVCYISAFSGVKYFSACWAVKDAHKVVRYEDLWRYDEAEDLLPANTHLTVFFFFKFYFWSHSFVFLDKANITLFAPCMQHNSLKFTATVLSASLTGVLKLSVKTPQSSAAHGFSTQTGSWSEPASCCCWCLEKPVWPRKAGEWACDHCSFFYSTFIYTV